MNASRINPLSNRRVLTTMVWQPFRAQASRTVLAVLAVALGVALGLAIFLMTRAATAETTRASRSLFGQADLIVQGTDEGFDETLYPIVATIPGVAVASPVIEVRALVGSRHESLVVIGMDFLRAVQLQTIISGTPRSRGNLSSFDSSSIQLNSKAAQTLQAKVGDELSLQVGTALVPFKVVGILPGEAYSQEVGILDIASAQWRLGRLGKLTRIELRVNSAASIGDVIDAIARVLPADVKVTTPADESRMAERLSRPIRINLLGVALVALFTGVFLVYSTQSLAIVRRRREFALLRALGVTKREQMAAVIYTGGVLGLLGSAFGIALGIALAHLGLHFIAADTAAQLQIVPLEIAGFALLGVLASVFGSIAPALAAARIPVAHALKAGNVEQANTRGHVYVALLFWVLNIPLLLAPPLFDLPIFGYTAVAFILFGAVLCIPAFTRATLSLLPRRRHVGYQTAIAQLRGMAHTATTSVATMLVSVSLMVAMSIMGASLRGSMAQWVEHMYPADIYLRPVASGLSYFEPATLDALTSIEGIKRATSGRTTQLLLAKDRPPVTLDARFIDPDNPEATLEIIKSAQRAAPSGAVAIWISGALASRELLSADDLLVFQLAGRDVTGSVRGVYRDYQQNAALQMNYRQYVDLTGDRRANSLAIWLKPAVDAQAVVRSVHERLNSKVEIEVTLPGDYRARILRGFDALFGIIYLLLAVSVLIGLFGIGVNASAQVLARRAEFGVLRHLGFTRDQIGDVLSIEGLCLGALGVLSGLLIGSVISAVMIYVITPQSFNWTMDLHVPTATLIALSIIVPIAAALTARWSGRSAMNDDVVRAVKEDW